MLRLPLIAASLAALALPLDARAAGGIAFDRATAEPNEHVRVTSALDVPLRLHLVRKAMRKRSPGERIAGSPADEGAARRRQPRRRRPRGHRGLGDRVTPAAVHHYAGDDEAEDEQEAEAEQEQ